MKCPICDRKREVNDWCCKQCNYVFGNLKIVHTYINNMGIDENNLDKTAFADRWGLVTSQREGHDVTLICGSNKNKRKEYTWKGIKIIELPVRFELTTSSRIVKGMYKELMNINADIFHTHHYCSFVPEITAIVGKIRKIPTYITLHNTFKEREGLIGIAEKLYLIFLQPFFPLYEKVFFISKYLMARKYFLVSKEKKDLLYNQIDKPKKLKMKRKKHNILFIGRIVPQKGLDILLKALIEVKKEIPNFRLNIVGSGDLNRYNRKIENILRENNLTYNVKFYGKLYGKEKWEQFFSNSLLVVPSRNEAYGNVAKEGLLCGITTIVSNNGALPEVVNYNQDLIFKDVEDLSNKIMVLIKNG